jgi:outer membrane protein insertion porin family
MKLIQLDLVFGYGIPLSNDSRIILNLNTLKMKLNAAHFSLALDMNLANVQIKEMMSLKLNINWSKNTLNDYLYPTNGVNNSLSARNFSSIGDYKYFNVNADHKAIDL